MLCMDSVGGELCMERGGKVMVGGELVMIAASMMGRSDSCKDGWFRECHGNVCGEWWKR